jgi:hypothetical protein
MERKNFPWKKNNEHIKKQTLSQTVQSEHGENEHGDKYNKHELNEHEKKKKSHKRTTKWINIVNKKKNDTNGKTKVLPTFITMGSWCESMIMWKLVKNPKV